MTIQSLDFTLDINGDGVYSRWEIWESVVWAYRLPGNLLVEGLGNIPFVSGLLGIQASPATGYASLNGPVAVALSLLFWLSMLLLLARLSSGSESRSDTGRPIPLLSWDNPAKSRPGRQSAYH